MMAKGMPIRVSEHQRHVESGLPNKFLPSGVTVGCRSGLGQGLDQPHHLRFVRRAS